MVPPKDLDLTLPISLIVLSEILLFFHQSRAAAVISGLNLASIYILETYYDDRACQVLMLIPLFRLLNLSVPSLLDHTIYPYLLTYAIITIPIFLIARRGLFSQSKMGITLEGLKAYLPMTIAIGLIL